MTERKLKQPVLCIAMQAHGRRIYPPVQGEWTYLPPGFAVHRRHMRDDIAEIESGHGPVIILTDGWNVTHVRSGLVIARADSQTAALRAGHALAEIEGLTEISNKDIADNADLLLAIAKALRPIKGLTFPDRWWIERKLEEAERN